jgi:hypothetical protein
MDSSARPYLVLRVDGDQPMAPVVGDRARFLSTRSP